MKVYMAARFSRLPEVRTYADQLEAAGVTVTSRWIRGGHEWVGTPDEEIPVDRLAQFAREDIADLVAAETVVCFTEPARTGPARGGRHVEFGYALACGKKILVVGHRENVFYCLRDVTFAPDWASAWPLLIEMVTRPPTRLFASPPAEYLDRLAELGEMDEVRP